MKAYQVKTQKERKKEVEKLDKKTVKRKNCGDKTKSKNIIEEIVKEKEQMKKKYRIIKR